MTPAEAETPDGLIKWPILRAMFAGIASQSSWIATLSNFALGSTGIYVGLLFTNFETIGKHLPHSSELAAFWLAMISAIVGISVQILSGWAQFAINVESQMLNLLLPELAKHADDPSRFLKILESVRADFINSRPRPFRWVMRWASEKGKQDVLFVSKTAATFAQIAFALLVAQYIMLGAAIFWPLGALTMREKRVQRHYISLPSLPQPKWTHGDPDFYTATENQSTVTIRLSH